MSVVNEKQKGELVGAKTRGDTMSAALTQLEANMRADIKEHKDKCERDINGLYSHLETQTKVLTKGMGVIGEAVNKTVGKQNLILGGIIGVSALLGIVLTVWKMGH